MKSTLKNIVLVISVFAIVLSGATLVLNDELSDGVAAAESANPFLPQPGEVTPIQVNMKASVQGQDFVFQDKTIKTTASSIIESGFTNTSMWYTYNPDDLTLGTLGSGPFTDKSKANMTVTLTIDGPSKTTIHIDSKLGISPLPSTINYYFAYELTTKDTTHDAIKQYLFYKVVVEFSDKVQLATPPAELTANHEYTGEGSIKLVTKPVLSGAKWYAHGLPNGLGMSSEGVVTGIPLETGSKKVTIILTDNEGNAFDTAWEFEVVAATVDISVEVTGGNSVFIGDKDKSRYMINSNEELTFNIHHGDLTIKSVQYYSSEGGTLTVKDIGVDSSVTSPAGITAYKQKITGVGETWVKITYGNSDSIAMFSLLVIQKVSDVQTGIEFNLNYVPAEVPSSP